jgi:hypothetical protein
MVLAWLENLNVILEAADHVGVQECVQMMISYFGKFERSLDGEKVLGPCIRLCTGV